MIIPHSSAVSAPVSIFFSKWLLPKSGKKKKKSSEEKLETSSFLFEQNY